MTKLTNKKYFIDNKLNDRYTISCISKMLDSLFTSIFVIFASMETFVSKVDKI